MVCPRAVPGAGTLTKAPWGTTGPGALSKATRRRGMLAAAKGLAPAKLATLDAVKGRLEGRRLGARVFLVRPCPPAATAERGLPTRLVERLVLSLPPPNARVMKAGMSEEELLSDVFCVVAPPLLRKPPCLRAY